MWPYGSNQEDRVKTVLPYTHTYTHIFGGLAARVRMTVEQGTEEKEAGPLLGCRTQIVRLRKAIWDQDRRQHGA